MSQSLTADRDIQRHAVESSIFHSRMPYESNNEPEASSFVRQGTEAQCVAVT